MHIFFEPDINNNGGYLNEEETHHCIKVLRLKKNDSICVINGKGSIFDCTILDYEKSRCKIIIERENFSTEPNSNCHIAIAPTKNISRFEWFIEKSTEIGIREITPLLCKNSERKNINSERIEKIITSATKQSLSLWKPKLNAFVSFKEFISLKKSSQEQKFIAYCSDNLNKKELKKCCEKNRNVLIMIGPEGDFLQDEVNFAIENDFQPISLGNKRLRTETAALVATLIVQLIN